MIRVGLKLECGEKICTSECRFLGSRCGHPGCLLFNVPLFDSTGGTSGAVLRCKPCKDNQVPVYKPTHRDHGEKEKTPGENAELCPPAKTELWEQGSPFTVQTTTSSFCGDCDAPVRLLSAHVKYLPAFYVCTACNMIAQIGVGVVEDVDDEPRKAPPCPVCAERKEMVQKLEDHLGLPALDISSIPSLEDDDA